MGSTKLYLSITVVCLIIIEIWHCNAALENLESSEKCVNIYKCEPVLRLMRVPMVRKKIWRQVARAHCGFEGNDHKVYCDVEKIIRRPERFEVVLDAHSVNDMPTATPPAPVDPLSSSTDKHPNFRLLDHDICGPVPQNYREQAITRIIGGKEAEIDEFPWMALLIYRENYYRNNKIQFRCGGTVINRNHVMTAAHCVTHLHINIKLSGVRVGEYDLSSERDCKNGIKCNYKHEDFKIDEVYPHPDYSNENYHNDIAIIRLKGSIDFKRTHIRPICLPIDKAEVLPMQGIVTGWGSLGDDSPNSRVLQKVTLPIVSLEKCQILYSDVIKIGYKQFCAGGYRGMDSCSGDSGGPLQVVSLYRGSFRMVQRGIVSYGRSTCGLEDSPGVYTSVADYMHWILNTIRA
ncbi:CLIP domain-containing serine protease B4-like [Phymastichus coffea]|uniref:CLIP domain-containing serine protease B4-like n=1 Tax=Phymastichus coffea TaxID=108790 RepID=UPI00273B18AF|nr:CLIP domain-containing serine protease B4-like [Phymastichus coffea]